jgi:fused signal recognition particle receptor
MGRLLKHGKGKPSLWSRIKDIAFTDVGVLVRGGVDEGSLERIEEILLGSDFGVDATMQLLERVEELSRLGKIRTEQQFLDTVEGAVRDILLAGQDSGALNMAETPPTVLLVVGVNGVGKTTSIGKLARHLSRLGHRPLLAAADTFRAGAIDQLRIWAERSGVEFVGSAPGADPASVAFDAIDAAESRDRDVVIIDTAGRLHTQDDLMGEIAKVHRVVARRLQGAPHETLLVLDATVGQNAMAQAKTFQRALPLTGLVLAKLDSTARGGIVVALKQELGLPVKFVGTGEDVDDLAPFDAQRFASAVLTG